MIAAATSKLKDRSGNSHVTRHTSHVTRHTSHVLCHTSHVTRHTSHITRHVLTRYDTPPAYQLLPQSCGHSRKHHTTNYRDSSWVHAQAPALIAALLLLWRSSIFSSYVYVHATALAVQVGRDGLRHRRQKQRLKLAEGCSCVGFC
jgi:hypothetical protein